MKIEEIEKAISELDGQSLHKLKELVDRHHDIIVLGNGGSNAIASHISQDYTKALGKRSLCFSDGSQLTCYTNDYGQDNAFSKFIEHYASKEHLIILISSSGNSQNILNCAKLCESSGLEFVILSGFDHDNLLNTVFKEKSSCSFWVDSKDYGVVECVHQIILHTVI